MSQMLVRWIPAQAEWVIASETVASRDAGSELTWMYLQRVSEAMTHSAAARTALQQYPVEGAGTVGVY